MSENIQRNRGRSKNYKFDRGGTPLSLVLLLAKLKTTLTT
jgi:hypothetical protein